MNLSKLMSSTNRTRFMAVLITVLMAFAVSACGDDGNSGGDSNNTPDTTTNNDTPDAGTNNGTPDTTDPDTNEPDTIEPDTEEPDITAVPGCEELATCLTSCPTDGSAPTCQDDCFASASTEAGTAYSNFRGCLGASCAEASDVVQCAADNCAAVYTTCFGEPSGSCLPNCTGADDTTTCGAGNKCVGLADGETFICVTNEGGPLSGAAACDLVNPCATNESCITFTEPPTEDACELPPAENTCPDGEACYQTQTFNTCAPFNPDAKVDDPCTGPLDCNEGQLCVGPAAGGPSTCQLRCDTTATDSVCATDQTCAGLQGGGTTGVCTTVPDDECTPLPADNDCPTAGEACYTTGLGNTICEPFKADANIGDTCTAPTDCNEGQICTGDPSAATGTCQLACDPAATTSICETGDTCVAFTNNPGLGVCTTVPADECTPLPAENDCPTAGEACYTTNLGNTVCEPFKADAKIGDTCTAAGDCNEGQICAGSSQGGTCQLACDPAATTSICETGDICQAFEDNPGLGVCAPEPATGG